MLFELEFEYIQKTNMFIKLIIKRYSHSAILGLNTKGPYAILYSIAPRPLSLSYRKLNVTGSSVMAIYV